MPERYDPNSDEILVFNIPNGYVGKLTGNEPPCDAPTDEHPAVDDRTQPVDTVEKPCDTTHDPDEGRFSGTLPPVPPLPPAPPPANNGDDSEDGCPSWLERHRFLVGMIVGATSGFLLGTLWTVATTDTALSELPATPPPPAPTTTHTETPQPGAPHLPGEGELAVTTIPPPHSDPPPPVPPHTDPAPLPDAHTNQHTAPEADPTRTPPPETTTSTGSEHTHPPTSDTHPSTNISCPECETPDQQADNPFVDFFCRVFDC